MGVAWSTYKQTRERGKKQKRKCTLSPSERKRLLKIKAEMEGEIQALEEQICLEKLAQIARGNRPQHMNEGSSSTGINKPDTNLQKDRFESQPCPLESERQMLDALQFAWFQRKNPLENWTVGSLPSLRDIWYAKKDDNTRAQQKHFYREH